MAQQLKPSYQITWLPVTFGLVGLGLMIAGLPLEWMGEPGNAAAQYCEAARDRWIRQPANSWSNLAFILAGWAIAFQSVGRISKEHAGPFERTSFNPVLLSMLAVFLGLGSFAYHASTTPLGGSLDESSMFLLSSFMLAYALMRLLELKTYQFAIVYALGLIISSYVNQLGFVLGGGIDDGGMIFGGFLIASAGIELYLIYIRKISIESNWAMAFIGTFILSVIIWTRSRTGAPWCDPSSLLQGHAIWHILDASCVYFIYRYYRSELRSEGLRPITN